MPRVASDLPGECSAGEERGGVFPEDRPGHEAVRGAGVRRQAELAGACVDVVIVMLSLFLLFLLLLLFALAPGVVY